LKINKDYFKLYAVTSRDWHKKRSLTIAVRNAIEGGATMIQLREKNVLTQIYTNEAVSIKAVCEKYRVPLIINDSIDVVFGSRADGVHIGQDDVTVKEARQELGEDRIIGVSVQTVEQALAAQADGADYLGVGAIFATDTKTDAEIVPIATLKAITEAVDIPVCAIGGITEQNVGQLAGTGIDGVAVVSAIFAEPDTKIAAAKLRDAVEATL
jgi:thiamine-phosphate pyrophosphorylase